MKVRAVTKSVRISPRKVRLVADAVSGMSVNQAMSTLTITNKRGALILLKTIKSAVANAVNNAKMSEDGLLIDRLEVQEGPFLKRFHASTRGRVHPYKKRSSRIIVTLKEKGEKKSEEK